jgi:hypothetical protein
MHSSTHPALLAAAAAAAILLAPSAPAKNLEKAYHQAVQDAAVAEESEIATDLVAVDPDDDGLVWNADGTRIKVVTWKAQGAFDRFIEPYDKTSDNPDYVVWVTLAPRIQAFCREFLRTHPQADAAGLDLRLKQRLGLHPDWTYDVFVELWVSPDDLFRPCVDPGTGDHRCELEFGKTVAQVEGIDDYRDFYTNLYFKSFRSPPGVPWTGLGYTYDWGGKGEQGESELILAPSSSYTVEAAVPTMDYCAP